MRENLNLFFILSFISVAIAFAFAFYLYSWVKKARVGNSRIEEVSLLIKDGANTFMKREYKILFTFAFIVAAIIFFFLPHPFWIGNIKNNLMMAVSYLCGTFFSAIAGKIGVMVATMSNGRVAESAKEGIRPAFLLVRNSDQEKVIVFDPAGIPFADMKDEIQAHHVLWYK